MTFVFIAGTSRKIWQITRKSRVVTHTWGRLSAENRQSKKFRFASPAEAKDHVARKTASKVAKGYHHVAL